MTRIEKILGYLQVTPGDHFLRHALALEYIKIGDDVKAKELFENILADNAGYTGSYYHLGKLLERTGETVTAIACYKKGMEMSLQNKEQHIYNELQSAYEDLIY